jgi:hypothetical protein
MPIVHVNADDPEACVEAARRHLSTARFQRFLITIGYQRYVTMKVTTRLYAAAHVPDDQ